MEVEKLGYWYHLGLFRLFLIAVFAISFFTSTYASNLVRLRDPKAPCGIYLSALGDSTLGKRISGLSKEELRANLLELREYLIPHIAYVDQRSGEQVVSAEKFVAGMVANKIRPEVKKPMLMIVGVPLYSMKGIRLQKEVESLLKELGDDHRDVKVKTIRQPQLIDGFGPDWAKKATDSLRQAHLWLQKLRYEGLMPNEDFQKPTKGEIEVTKTKLMTANALQTVVLATRIGGAHFGVADWAIGSAVNYTNSAFTGVFRRVISNWFSRATSTTSRIFRNLQLTSFFAAQQYWAVRVIHPEEFAKIGTVEGWLAFLGAKWSVTFFNVAFRYFSYQFIHDFEKMMDKLGRQVEGRRAAARFELFGTLIATPAFLIGTMVEKSGLRLQLGGPWVFEFGLPHAVILGTAAMFYALSRGLKYPERLDSEGNPIKFKRYWLDPLKFVEFFETVPKYIQNGFNNLSYLPSPAPSSALIPDYPDIKTQPVQNTGRLEDKIKNQQPLDQSNDLSWLSISQKDLLSSPEVQKYIENDPEFQKLQEELEALMPSSN